jgi:DNA-binding CsgD family transcriptional regulator
MRKIQLDNAAIAMLAEKGLSSKDIAESLGVSSTTIQRRLLSLSFKPPAKFPVLRDPALLKALLDQGKTPKEIAQTVGCHASSVFVAQDRFGLVKSRQHALLKNKEYLEKSLLEGYTLAEIGKEIGCSGNAVKGALKRLSIPYFRDGLADRPLELVDAMEKANGVVSDAAELLGYSAVHTQQVVTKLGLKDSESGTSAVENTLKHKVREIALIPVLYNTKCLEGAFELDLYFPFKNIGVELDGYYWHAEDVHRDKHNILHKHEKARDAGIRSIHILDVEWAYKREACVNILTAAISDSIHKIPARKCELRKVETKESRPFLDKYHMQGFVRSSLCVGLYFEEELVGLMSFGATRYSKKVTHELLRLSFKTGVSVIGGAARLLKYAQAILPMESIVSYCDRRLFSGAGYERLGFKLSHTSSPNYYYVKNNGNKESRVKYQKHKLAGILKNFDPALTEYQNMKANGYRRIWDAGNDVYVLTDAVLARPDRPRDQLV